jgi:riboflavin synthase
MFTGIIEGIGRIKTITRKGGDLALSVQSLFDMSANRIGDSVSINGVCLTITDIHGQTIQADVSGETLSNTTIGNLKPGDSVNIERALRLTDRLGGHLVSGHVDGIGQILKKESVQRSWRLRIGIPEDLARYTIEKGSVAIDGISLTINRCQNTFFEVNVIPETARQTTILKKKQGDWVNIETDLIAKYIEKLLGERKTEKDAVSLGATSKDAASKDVASKDGAISRVDREMLHRYGFGDSSL